MKKRNVESIVFLVLLFIGIIAGCGKKEETGNQLPKCHITYPSDGQEIVKGETVNILADASDSDGSITEVGFFIDNSKKGSFQDAPYHYNWETGNDTLGHHSIKVIASDNNGGNTQDEISVVLISGGGCIAPEAAFSANPTEGEAPLTVAFTDMSTNNPISWHWDFGDGSSGTQQNTTHIYNDEGNYTVQLIVSNGNCADTLTVSGYITVINAGCPDTVTDIDGNKYATTQIGSQCWMAENLKTTKYKNGTAIPYVAGDDNWVSLTSGAYVWPDNNISFKDSYGALYNGYAVFDPNGLCPEGWHIPTSDDWDALVTTIGGIYQGGKLKSCRQVNTPMGGDCNTNEHPRWEDGYTTWGYYGTDNYGFAGLPAGYRNYYTGVLYAPGNNEYWWSTKMVGDHVRTPALNFSLNEFILTTTGMTNGNSVRCIKD